MHKHIRKPLSHRSTLCYLCVQYSDTDVLALFLQMGFQKPQRLVQPTRNFSKDISGVSVARFICLIDARPNIVRCLAIALDQRTQMIRNGIDIERISRDNVVALAVVCVVPRAVPPSWTTRSAIVST